MQYIKHNWQFYQKIELKDLDKKELIKLITEAIEIEPKIVERWNTIYRDYWWYKPLYYNTPTVTIWWTITSTNASGDFTYYNKGQLLTLCSSL
jgi:hypothetical protein